MADGDNFPEQQRFAFRCKLAWFEIAPIISCHLAFNPYTYKKISHLPCYDFEGGRSSVIALIETRHM
jgi:hypothetical protein